MFQSNNTEDIIYLSFQSKNSYITYRLRVSSLFVYLEACGHITDNGIRRYRQCQQEFLRDGVHYLFFENCPQFCNDHCCTR